MGMIWNSPATKDMINTINYEFSVNIGKWQAQRDLFDRNNSGDDHELKNIAKNNGLFGGGAQGTDPDDRWQTWLDLLGRSYHTANSNHEKLRKAIYDGLDASRYDAIYFQIMPRPHGGAVKISQYPDANDRLMGVLIETPTIDAVKAAIRSKMRKRKGSSTKVKAKTNTKKKR
jgi:hypothetical protein